MLRYSKDFTRKVAAPSRKRSQEKTEDFYDDPIDIPTSELDDIVEGFNGNNDKDELPRPPEEGKGFLEADSFLDALKEKEEDQIPVTTELPVKPKGEEEDNKEEGDKEEESKEKKFNPSLVDKGPIEGRSDRQVLNDARAVARELIDVTKEIVDSGLTINNSVNNILYAGQNSLQNLMEQAKPGSTSTGSADIKSSFGKITDDIQEVIATWIHIINEKKSQAQVYEEMFRKLRLPQFRLPAWLESLATGTSRDIILKKRKERYQKAVDNFLRTKMPATGPMVRDFRALMQGSVDKLQANDNVIKTFFRRQGNTRFIREYAKKDSPLRSQLNQVLDGLVYDATEKKIYDEEPPLEAITEVKNNIKKVLRNYGAKTGRDLEVNEETVDAFIRYAIENREATLEAVKERIKEYKEPNVASFISRKVVAQQSVEQSQQQETERQADPKDIILLKQKMELLHKTLLDFIANNLMEGYANIVKLYYDENFAPSIRALGARWMEEYKEGTHKSYGLIETTREGDGEKLLTLFEQKRGIAERSMKNIGDFVKYIAEPMLQETIMELEELAEVRTPIGEKVKADLQKMPSEEEEDKDTDNDSIDDIIDSDDDNDTIPDQYDPHPKDKDEELAKTIKNQTINVANQVSNSFDDFEGILSQLKPLPSNRQSEEYKNGISNRYKLFKQFVGILKKAYDSFHSIWSKKTEAQVNSKTIRAFVRIAWTPGEVLTRPSTYRKVAEEVKAGWLALTNALEQEVGIQEAVNQLEKALSPSNVSSKLRLSGVNIYDESQLQALNEQLVGYYKDLGIALEGEEQQDILNKNDQQLYEELLDLSRRSLLQGVNKALRSQNMATSYSLQDFEGLNEKLLKEIDDGFEEQIEDLIVEGTLEEEDEEEVLRSIVVNAQKAGQEYVQQKVDLVKKQLESKGIKETDFKSNQEIVFESLNKPIDEIVEVFLKKVKTTYNPENKQDREEALGETHPMDTKGEESEPEAQQRVRTSQKNLNLTNRLMSLRKIQQAVNKSS